MWALNNKILYDISVNNKSKLQVFDNDIDITSKECDLTFVRLENNKSYQLFHRLALVASRMINLSKLSDLCTNDGEAWQASEHLRLITSIGDQNNNAHSKDNLSKFIDWTLVSSYYVVTKTSGQCHLRAKEWYLRLHNVYLPGVPALSTTGTSDASALCKASKATWLSSSIPFSQN